MLCPPPLIDSSSPSSRANVTARTTSRVEPARMTTAGRLATIAFQRLTDSA